MSDSILKALIDYRDFFIALHLFAMVIGLGGATYTDILLFDFLKDFKISKKETAIIKRMSSTIVIGVVLAFVSGLLLFLPKQDILLQTPKFQLKLIAFTILVINAIVLHYIIMPKLMKFSFQKDFFIIGKTIHIRHVSFVVGAISIVSWYTTFLIGAFSSIPLPFETLLSLYIAALIIAITIALLSEKMFKSALKK